MSDALFLREDAYALRRRALDIHLRRRRERHVRLSRQPALGWWQQPVGGVISAVLMAALIVAMYGCIYLVGSGVGGTP